MKISTLRNLSISGALLALAIAGSEPIWGLWPTHGARRPNQPGVLYWTGDKASKKVALTFDDGPSDPYTGEILDVLKEHDVKATFFLLGRNAEKYPDLAQRIVREGHVIGNHSFSHSDMAFFFKRRSLREIDQAENSIFRITGVRPTLFRPPHGRYSPGLLKLTRAEGLLTVEWSVSPKDWAQPSAAKIVKRVLNQVRNGSIILLHDGHPDTEPGNRLHTVMALPTLIAALRAEGYELVTVPELLSLQKTGTEQSARLPHR